MVLQSAVPMHLEDEGSIEDTLTFTARPYSGNGLDDQHIVELQVCYMYI